MVNFNQTFYVKGGSNNIYATKFTKILCKIYLEDGQLNVQYYCKFAPEPNKERHISVGNELYFANKPFISTHPEVLQKLTDRKNFLMTQNA